MPANVPMARLLGLRALGLYLGGLSYWTTRDLVAGPLASARVRLPLGDGRREVRRVLVDRELVDELVARWREGS